MSNYCGTCGKPLNPEINFCSYCGVPVGAPNLVYPEPKSSQISNTSTLFRSSTELDLDQRRHRRTGLIGVLAILSIGVPGWLYFSPYVILQNLREAALAGDTNGLKRTIDFPALRASLREELKGQVSKKSLELLSSHSDGFAVAGSILGATLVNLMVDRMVDQYVTPQVVASVAQGKTVAGAPDRVNGVVRRLTAKPTTGENAVAPRIVKGYESFDRFAIRIYPPKCEVAITFVLSRSGLANWRLSAIDLPDLDRLTAASAPNDVKLARPRRR
jgi:Protein of unknown function (DUF2939)